MVKSESEIPIRTREFDIVLKMHQGNIVRMKHKVCTIAGMLIHTSNANVYVIFITNLTHIVCTQSNRITFNLKKIEKLQLIQRPENKNGRLNSVRLTIHFVWSNVRLKVHAVLLLTSHLFQWKVWGKIKVLIQRFQFRLTELCECVSDLPQLKI